jgi:hypothetical protein
MNNKIFIAVPMFGGMCHGNFTNSLIQTIGSLVFNNIDFQYSFKYNESLIPRARNVLTHNFLKTDCTHLFFIDADISFRAEDVIKMIHADKDILCGIYPKKKIHWNKVYDAVKQGCTIEELPKLAVEYVYHSESGQQINLNEDTVVETNHAGTGFMLIKRSVFETMHDVPSYTAVDDMGNTERIKLFFDTSVQDKTEFYLSEDYHFCELWKRHKGKIHIAPWVQLNHIGSHVYGE